MILGALAISFLIFVIAAWKCKEEEEEEEEDEEEGR